MKCSACGGPYHPATGHVFSDKMVLCGSCAIDFKDWLKKRMAMMQARIKDKRTGQKNQDSFHDAAMKSTVAETKHPKLRRRRSQEE